MDDVTGEHSTAELGTAEHDLVGNLVFDGAGVLPVYRVEDIVVFKGMTEGIVGAVMCEVLEWYEGTCTYEVPCMYGAIHVGRSIHTARESRHDALGFRYATLV